MQGTYLLVTLLHRAVMARQAVIGLVIHTHLRAAGAAFNWERLAAKVICSTWETAAKKVAEHYASDFSPRHSRRWRSLPYIRNLVYSRLQWWRHASNARIKAGRDAIRLMRGTLLAAGGRSWTSNFVSTPPQHGTSAREGEV